MNEASKEFDRMREEWEAEVKVEAAKIMKEFICTPDHAFDVARRRWDRAADKKYTERQKAKDRELLAKTVRELPDCLFCGSRPVWHATSYEWVKCSGNDCSNRDAWYRPDQWRDRETKHAVQKVAYTAVVTSVDESAKETGITRYAECYAETGEDHNGWPLRAKVNVGINVDVNDRLRITVEKVGES